MNEISPNPFTPKSGWEPRVFIGRENEIEFFRKKLEEARSGRCDHFLILGDWGVGKTSLLKEFKKIAQHKGILASFITISEYTEKNTFNDGVRELIEEIPQTFPTDVSKLKKFMNQLNELGVQFLGAGFTFSRTIEEMQPQSLLFNSLKTLWDDLKNETEVAVVLIDDVQNFNPISGIFTILKNVLSDEEIVKTKFLFVLSCTPDMWKQFLVRHHPIGRYFTPRLNLERLSKQDTSRVLKKILENTGVVFDDKIMEMIYEYTQGHPYELQTLCYNLYENQISGRVTEKVWSNSFKNTLNELGEKVFDGLYERASKNEQKILYLMSLVNKQVSPQELLKFSNDLCARMSYTVINTGLQRLFKKGLVIKPEKYAYSLPDRIFREYVIRLKEINGDSDKIQKIQKKA